MKCRGCGRELGLDDYRMVAEWPFCGECFEGLMKKAEDRLPVRDGKTAEALSETHPAPGRCDLCQRPLEVGEGRRVLTWVLCPECYQDLILSPPSQAPPEENAAGPAVEPTHEAHDLGKSEGEEEPTVRVEVKLTSFVHCAGCGRRIPEAGSRVVDGAPLCPDCFYASLEPRESRPVPLGPVTTKEERGDQVHPEIGVRPDDVNRCAACGRSLDDGAFDRLEGFVICRACSSSDRDLALQIAREKHRRFLHRMKEQLDLEGGRG